MTHINARTQGRLHTHTHTHLRRNSTCVNRHARNRSRRRNEDACNDSTQNADTDEIVTTDTHTHRPNLRTQTLPLSHMPFEQRETLLSLSCWQWDQWLIDKRAAEKGNILPMSWRSLQSPLWLLMSHLLTKSSHSGTHIAEKQMRRIDMPSNWYLFTCVWGSCESASCFLIYVGMAATCPLRMSVTVSKSDLGSSMLFMWSGWKAEWCVAFFQKLLNVRGPQTHSF